MARTVRAGCLLLVAVLAGGIVASVLSRSDPARAARDGGPILLAVTALYLAGSITVTSRASRASERALKIGATTGFGAVAAATAVVFALPPVPHATGPALVLAAAAATIAAARTATAGDARVGAARIATAGAARVGAARTALAGDARFPAAPAASSGDAPIAAAPAATARDTRIAATVGEARTAARLGTATGATATGPAGVIDLDGGGPEPRTAPPSPRTDRVLAALLAAVVTALGTVVAVGLIAWLGPARLIPDAGPAALAPAARLAQSRTELVDPYVAVLVAGALASGLLAVLARPLRRAAPAARRLSAKDRAAPTTTPTL